MQLMMAHQHLSNAHDFRTDEDDNALTSAKLEEYMGSSANAIKKAMGALSEAKLTLKRLTVGQNDDAGSVVSQSPARASTWRPGM